MGERARKQGLRTRLLGERAALPHDVRAAEDALLALALFETEAWRAADAVLITWAVRGEVATQPIIERAWADGRCVALPRCTPGRTLDWFAFEPDDELAPGPGGIREPLPRESRRVDPKAACSALAVVPALAFDRTGARIGYGGGYYDCFLATFPGTAVGLCRRGMLIPSLAQVGALERHDAVVDLVITPDGLFLSRACRVGSRRIYEQHDSKER